MLASLMKRLHQPIYASRLRALVPLMTAHLRENDQVLDVGCGAGSLGRAIMESPNCPARVTVTGLEVEKRDGEPFIFVTNYDGEHFPFPENAFDMVILADVLHHADDPHRLIRESLRVARRGLLIYWITRLWLLANRGVVTDDAVEFASRDPVTYVVAGLTAAVLYAATVGIQPLS